MLETLTATDIRHFRTKQSDASASNSQSMPYIIPPPLMLAADHNIFFLPAETHLENRHPDPIELWISRAKPIVAMSIRDASLAIKWMFRSITGFFTRTTHHHTLKDPREAHPPRPRCPKFLPSCCFTTNPAPCKQESNADNPP
jgi:hypothetical protein